MSEAEPNREAAAPASVRVIDRTMLILRTLADSAEAVTLTDLSHKVGLHKSTVLRFLKALEQGGFVACGSGGKGWRPGPVFLDIRSRAFVQQDLAVIARPFMEEAVRLTGETVQIAVLPDTSIVYIAKVEPLDPPLRLNSQIGSRRPIHCTALGKVLAAHRSRAEIDGILGTVGLPGFTPRTITTARKLHACLKQVRRDGCAIDDREFNELVNCVATPIRDARGRVIAGLSISSFGTSVESPRFAGFVEVARSTAARISELLGYQPSDEEGQPS